METRPGITKTPQLKGGQRQGGQRELGQEQRVRGQAGQSTVEYALVLLGAAALALLLLSWVTGSDVIGRLFETVFGGIIERAG